MPYEVTHADFDLLKRLGLQVYKVGLGTYVRPAPEFGEAADGTMVPNPNYKPVSKSAAHNFRRSGGTKPGGVVTAIEDTKDGHLALEAATVILYYRGPTAKLPFTLAAEYCRNKPFKTWEEASEIEREFQTTSPDLVRAREQVHKAKLAKAERSGLVMMKPEDAVAPLVEAIQALTAQNAAQPSRGPGRPPKPVEQDA